MISELRKKFNSDFTEEGYRELLAQVEKAYPGALDFRIAETPVFVDTALKNEMLGTCENIISLIRSESFLQMTANSIPENCKVPGLENFPECMVFDFGICEGLNGKPQPMLIEMQGFPSLFAYQIFLSRLMKDYARVPDNFDSFLNGYDEQSYSSLLKDIILDGNDPSEVVLLEIFPDKQKTRIDFRCTEKLLDISTVCYTELIRKGNQLFYKKEGKENRIKRIYNRMIFDDLFQQSLPEEAVDIIAEYDVEWIPHPNWFYRISKYTLPFISDKNVPETFFLNELKQPLPLEEYVLKPLFSFAGMGVKLDVTHEDLESISDPQNWILQRKVNYKPVIETPDEPAKVEIRIFYLRKKEWERPKAIHNLARLSKGEMIGTRYNLNRTWVGGSIAFFEK